MAPEIALPKEEVARWKKNAKAKVLRDKIRDQALAAKSHGGSSAQTMTTTKADLESMVTRPVLEAIVQLRKESAENREAVFEKKPAGRTEELVRDWEGKIRVLEGTIAGLQIEAAESYKDWDAQKAKLVNRTVYLEAGLKQAFEKQHRGG